MERRNGPQAGPGGNKVFHLVPFVPFAENRRLCAPELLASQLLLALQAFFVLTQRKREKIWGRKSMPRLGRRRAPEVPAMPGLEKL